MTHAKHLSGRFHRPKGLRRWITILLLPVVLLMVAAYFYLTSAERLADLAGHMLSELTGARVAIDSAQFNPDASITLQGVRLRIPGIKGEQARLFHADQVLIKHRLRSLARGSFEARRVTFIRSTLYRTENIDTGISNFDILLRQRSDQAQQQPHTKPIKLPEILIREGGIQCGEVRNSHYTQLGAIRVEGRLTPKSQHTEAYRVVIRQLPDDDNSTAAPPPAMTGEFDLATAAFSAKIDAFSFEGKQKLILPAKLRQWWDQLEPDGDLSQIHFGFNPAHDQGVFAKLTLDDIGISIPFPNAKWRMEHVAGQIDFRNEAIHVKSLAGRLQGIGYTLDGWIGGFTPESPLRVAIVTEPFQVTKDMHDTPALPKGVKRLFERFAPRGTFAVNAVLERLEPKGPLDYTGNVLVSDAHVRFHKFAYPLENVSGRVQFDEQLVQLQNLIGQGPSGATVEVSGEISPPNEDAAVNVTVIATDGPIDRHIFNALKPEHLAATKLFLDQDAYQQLASQSLIQSENDRQATLEQLVALRALPKEHDPAIKQKIADAENRLAPPIFELGGNINVNANVIRPLAGGQKYETTVDLNLAGMRVLYRHWPYPLIVERGSLHITPTNVKVTNIVARGLSGGILTANGTIVLKGPNGIQPDLKITATNVPCDRYLMATIPQNRRMLVEQAINPSGTLDAHANVFFAKNNHIDFTIKLAMNNGQLQPQGTNAIIDHVNGNLTLYKDRFQLHPSTAKLRGSDLNITASGDWTRNAFNYILNLDIKNLAIDHRLPALIPNDHPAHKQLQHLVNTYNPTGLIDADIAVNNANQDYYAVTIKPHQLAFDIKDARVDINQMAGQATVTPGMVTLENTSGSFGTGRATASGQLTLDRKAPTDITFNAAATRVCPTTRLVLPDVVLDVIDSLELDGQYATQNAHLWIDHTNKPPGIPPTFGFRCQLDLQNAKALIGVPITKLNGTVDIAASRDSSASWPNMDFRIHAQNLLAAERLITPLSVRMTTTQKGDELKINELRGSCYGGVLLGSGRVSLAQDGAYQLGLTLQDVSLDPFVHPAKYNTPEPLTPPQHAETDTSQKTKKPKKPTGQLAANLTIEGSPTDPTSRRGRGELEIKHAILYEVPLALTLMQVVNFSIPAASSFNRASAIYLIDGDWVHFDKLSLEAPTVQMQGSGKMKYSTLELDLNMITRNPAGPVLGPVSDLFAVFKDELITINVAGTLDKPVPKVTSFTGIRRTWDDLFGPSNKPTPTPLKPQQ